MQVWSKLRKPLLAFMIACVAVFAVSTFLPEHSYAATFKERMKSNGGGVAGLETQVDTSTNTFIDTARKVFISLSILFGFWLAIGFIRSGFSPETLRTLKTQAFAFLGFLILTFWTEPILGFLLGIFGVDVAKVLG